MKNQTIKTALIVIGSAIGGILLFITILVSIAYYKFSDSLEFSPEVINSPPPITEEIGFLGSGGAYSSKFSKDESKILSEGKGKIIGKITANGKPVEGLRIQLALNNSIMSQWAVSDSNGQYTISVPFGKYKIYGYMLDYNSANKALPGVIDHPYNAHESEVMTINENRNGRGLDLEYVDPVIYTAPVGDISISQIEKISWEPYPKAKSYRIQLIEQKDPRNYREQKRIYSWEDRPTVKDNFINVNESSRPLREGFYYTVTVEALDENNRILSKTASKFSNPDFLITK